MILITATGRWATAQTTDILTTGSVGIPVSFSLSSEFDGLSPIAVFKGSGGTYDIAIVPGVTVPHETLATPGGMLEIGVYARNEAGTIVIPTVWATVGYIREGVAPSGVDPSQPTPDWTAQVQSIATEALEVATQARDDAATGAAAAQSSAESAAGYALDSYGYSQDASGFATAAETAQGKAEDAQSAAELAASAAKDDADFLRNASATATTLSPGSDATVTLDNGEFAFGIPRGEQGEQGEPGEDGISPVVTVTETASGWTVQISDAHGITYFAIKNGTNGQDGVSPNVVVTDITGGHRVTITDAQGTDIFDVMDGEDGADGSPGTAATVEVGTVTTLPAGSDATVTNSGTSSAAVFNFGIPKGDTGAVSDVQANGTSVVSGGVANIPVANSSRYGVIRSSSNGSVLIDDTDGYPYINKATDAEVKAGTSAYKPIVPSNQGNAVFYGLASAAGSSMSSSANAVGTYTEAALSAIAQMLNAPQTVSGTTPSITAKAGVRYVCGECATLTVTLPASGIVDVVFKSGSTATVLTVTPPTGATLSWANGFDPTSLDASTTYEINIMAMSATEFLGVAGSWT